MKVINAKKINGKNGSENILQVFFDNGKDILFHYEEAIQDFNNKPYFLEKIKKDLSSQVKNIELIESSSEDTGEIIDSFNGLEVDESEIYNR